MDRLDSEPYRFSGPHRAPLAALFRRVASSRSDDATELDEAVCAFAREARAEGVPSERVVIALNDIAQSVVRDKTPVDGYRRAVERVVTLAIDAYYRDD